MKIQAIKTKLNQNKRMLTTTLATTMLAFAPLSVANAQKMERTDFSKDKIELTQGNKKDKVPARKAYALLIGSAVGMVATALFCAWEPKNKNGTKS